MTRTASLPFPAIVERPDGSRLGPARVHVDDERGCVRVFGVVSGAVALLAEAALVEPMAMPTREARDWRIPTVEGDWTLRRGGCP